MNQGQCGTAVSSNNALSITGAVTTLENQQETITQMTLSLEAVLYGSTPTNQKPDTLKMDGIESRVNGMVTTNDMIISRLERILSKM